MSKHIRVKPGKTQSMIGAIAGGIFVIIGLFVVVPTFGPFGIVWTLFAVLIFGQHVFNATSDKGIHTHEFIVEEDGASSAKSRMEELESLYNSGLITRDEYEEKRKDILDNL